MKLEEIQDAVLAALNAAATLNGIPKLVEDGTYPKTPGREDALDSPGLLLVVWQPESEGLREVASNGDTLHAVSCHVVIEENVVKNRAVGGTGINVQQAVTRVMQAVAGAGSPAARKQFVPLDPPFKFFGQENGVQRAAVGFGVVLLTLAD